MHRKPVVNQLTLDQKFAQKGLKNYVFLVDK
jgi:hypothetical protein